MTSVHTSCGFDPLLFEADNTPFIQSVICPICIMVCRDPVEANNAQKDKNLPACGHMSCEKCMVKWLEVKHERPTYRQIVYEDQLNPAFSIRRLIANCRVKCANFKEGCEWKGELGFNGKNFHEHHDKLCPFTVIECPYKGDDQVNVCSPLPRKDMVEHMKQCSKRPILCELCHTSVPLYRLDGHLRLTCSHALI